MFTTKLWETKSVSWKMNLALNDRLNEPGGRIMIHLKSQIGVASSQFVSAFIPGKTHEVKDVFPSNSLSVCCC